MGLSENLETPITGVRISTVVPGKSRGETREDHELTNKDLALKLHYIKGVYFFKSTTTTTSTSDDDHDHDQLVLSSVAEMKNPMFPLLDRFFVAAGRIRRRSDDSERPYIMCNDAGVRIVEACCDKTVDEWLAEFGSNNYINNFNQGLCYDQVLGPDLGFSPLVYLQFTWFKCGGLSVGLSWAHLLGDVLSSSTFIKTWAQIMTGHVPEKPLHLPSCAKLPEDSSPHLVIPKRPFSAKELDPVGNHWKLTVDNCQNMRTHSFSVTSKQLDLLMSNTCGKKAAYFSRFEILSAVIWKSLSRIRENMGAKVVTVCWYDSSCGAENYEIPNNKSMMMSTVEADLEVDVPELAFFISNKRIVDNYAIEKMVGKEIDLKLVDYFVYGANLTFVDLEEVDIYGVEVKGQKPVFASYTIDGVGEEGLVLVLPAGPKYGHEGEDLNGRTVTVVLPKDEIARLENELKAYWTIA